MPRWRLIPADASDNVHIHVSPIRAPFAVDLNFSPVLYFDFRIAGSRPAKCTAGRRTQLSSSNILEQTRATANKAFRFQRDSDQSNSGSWPAEQISRCECNLLFLTRKPGHNRSDL